MNSAYGYMTDARFDVHEAEQQLKHMDHRKNEYVDKVMIAVKDAGKGIEKGKDFMENGKGKLDQELERFFDLGFAKGMDAGKTFAKGVANYHIKQARREIEKGKRDTEKGHGKNTVLYTELHEKGKRDLDIEKGHGKNTEINEKGKRMTFGNQRLSPTAKNGGKGGKFYPRMKKGRIGDSPISDMQVDNSIPLPITGTSNDLVRR